MRIRFILAALAALFSLDSHALAGFSRACSLQELKDKYLLDAFILFADKVSDKPKNYYLYKYSILSRNQLTGAFVPESITTDYGNARYGLFAHSRVYQLNTSTKMFEVVREYVSSPLGIPRILKPIIRNDSALMLIFGQGGIIPYSARAGSPSLIVEFYNTGIVVGAGELGEQPTIKVLGNHQFYEFPASQWRHLPMSSASDCNLRDWGFEH